MEEFQSSRRRQAQEDLGLTTQKEQNAINRSLEKEERRKAKKEAKRRDIEDSASYQMVHGIAKCMDKYFLDPILGFILPGIGDALTSVLVAPFIYVSAVKIRSLSLTLAVIFNTLVDVLLGMIPFFIGDIADVFNRSYLKNVRLIDGFVNDDKAVIEEVNRKAVWMGILIAILCYLIYLMVQLVIKVGEWIGSAWDSVMGMF